MTDRKAPKGLPPISFVSADRLCRRHVEIVRVGATPNGAVDRLALSGGEIDARKLLSRLAADLGSRREMDAISNMFVRCGGIDADAAPAVSGSHLDPTDRGPLRWHLWRSRRSEGAAGVRGSGIADKMRPDPDGFDYFLSLNGTRP